MDQLILPYPITDANDDPVSGALLYVYRTGTTTLSTDIYEDEAGTAAHTNPVECDGSGRPPQVFFDGGYAVRVKATTPAGATLFDIDPVSRAASATTAASNISFVPLDTNSATNVQDAIENLQDDVDSYALTAGQMDPGSAAAPGMAFSNDTDTGFYRSASNVLAFSEGGTDRGGLYGRKNITGTVSQTSGTPTGAVIERGSNANGRYVRFADGTQICWYPQFATASSASAIWTYPAAFSATPSVTAQMVAGNVAQFCTVGVRSTTSCAVYSFDASGSAAVSPAADLTAIGYWF